MLEENNKLKNYYNNEESEIVDYQKNLKSIQSDKKLESRGLNKSQKMAVILLAFFAVFVIVIWSIQFKKSISQPFTYKESESTTVTAIPSEEDSEEALKIKDTDNDGLFDWDELYFYKTSPYLEDSDSDGFSDKEEIDSDNDPNCPEGRDCYSTGIIDGDNRVVNQGGEESDNSSLDDLLGQLNINQNLVESKQTISQDEEELLQSFLSGQIDVTNLRKMLVEAGMNEELLNQISDEDLIKSYQELLEG
jgi:hypothetical protein